MTPRVVVLATGGTIAGTAASPRDDLAYRAAVLPVGDLLGAMTPPPGLDVEAEQVAQIDSKDMDLDRWLTLARRARFHLARPEVHGLVVTHGTDTLEETAWFLQRTLAPAKALVLSAAMRPANSPDADGPRNLADAMRVAADGSWHGVVAVMAGRVHGARGLRKLHPFRLDAFDSGDDGPLGRIDDGRALRQRDTPLALPALAALIDWPAGRWPRVAMISSHAGADGDLVRLAAEAGYRGLVVVGTGHATVHESLELALDAARASGIEVWSATRCTASDGVGSLPGSHDAGWFTPAQARVELLLRLAAADAAAAGAARQAP